MANIIPFAFRGELFSGTHKLQAQRILRDKK
jgi:hypothetical protein